MYYSIHPDLLLAIKLVYEPCDFQISEPVAEIESQEYGASSFMINSKTVRFRVSKITSKKIGQFVTIWKRRVHGPIEPFHISDEFDLIIISSRDGSNFGQFIFPKDILHSKGIISDLNKEGKRGIRVYPPWDKAVNSQAIKTQKWQLEHFLNLTGNKPLDLKRATKLLETIQETKANVCKRSIFHSF